MKIWTFSIIWNEAKVLPLFLRHYETFVDKMVFWVEPGTDATEEILRAHPKAWVLKWPHTGLCDDEFRNTFNYWPHRLGIDHNVDFAITCDADELLWHQDPIGALNVMQYDAATARGYALIDPAGFPRDDGRQVYDQVRTGVRQPNYDKMLIFRPGFRIEFSHGRHEVHYYGGRIPPLPTWRLFHLHHLWGAGHTGARNKRNLDRCLDKKYGWAYTEKQEQQRSGGTVGWVNDAIQSGRLMDVMKDPL